MPEKPSFNSGRGRLLALGAACCLVALSAIRDGVLLTRHDIPPGIDGFYYAVQARSFVESATFYYPTPTPFVLYIMGAAAKLGGDVFAAVKGTSILLHVILSLSLFALAASITRSTWAGLLAAAVAVSSGTHLIWISEFLKQLGGLAFFFAGVACLTLNRESNARRLAAVVLLAVSVLCHKSLVFLIATVLCLGLLFHLLIKIRRLRLALVLASAVILFGVCLPAVAARGGIPLPRQISETVLSSPRLPIKRTAFEEKFALLLLAPLGLALCLKEGSDRPARPGHYAVGVAALFTILFTLNPFLSHEEELLTISERLDLLSYIQISVLLPGVFWLLRSGTVALGVALSVICLLLLGNHTLPKGVQEGFLARRTALLNDLTRVRGELPPDAIIIAPHGVQFLVTYATGASSQNSAPTSAGREADVMWLVSGAPCRAAQNAVLVSRGRRCTFLVREAHPLPVTADEKGQIMVTNPHLKNVPQEVLGRVLAPENPSRPSAPSAESQ